MWWRSVIFFTLFISIFAVSNQFFGHYQSPPPQSERRSVMSFIITYYYFSVNHTYATDENNVIIFNRCCHRYSSIITFFLLPTFDLSLVSIKLFHCYPLQPTISYSYRFSSRILRHQTHHNQEWDISNVQTDEVFIAHIYTGGGLFFHPPASLMLSSVCKT